MAAPFHRQADPGGGSTNKKLAFWALFTAIATAGYSAQHVVNREPLRALAREQRHQQSANIVPAGRSPAEIAPPNLQLEPSKIRNTYISTNNDFVSALAPARVDDAVGAPSARGGQSSGLSSLPQARSLQDWEVEDFILVATIDGSLHAIDRNSGKERWALGNPESPMIKTTRHRPNRSNSDDLIPEDDFMFIVEPSLGGSLYIQHNDPLIGLQRLDMTVKSLVDRSPQLTRQPPLAFVASKEASMYTIDAATGHVKDFIDTTATYSSDDQSRGSCRRLSGFEIDEQDCEPVGILHVGRTTYTVVVTNGVTRNQICTIRYSEWAPNNGDLDLHSQHNAPFDGRRINPFHDGQFIGLEVSGMDRRTKFHGKLDTPIARVWDVARPNGHASVESSLIMLSAPADPASLQEVERGAGNVADKVFVNRTEAGWFAMSELRYPGVTSQARRAKVDKFAGFQTGYLDFDADPESLVGFHDLGVIGEQEHVPLTISAPQRVAISPQEDLALPPTVETPSYLSSLTSRASAVFLFLVIVAFALAFTNHWKATFLKVTRQKPTNSSIPGQKPVLERPNDHAHSRDFETELTSPLDGGHSGLSKSAISSVAQGVTLPGASAVMNTDDMGPPEFRPRQNSSDLQDQGSESESEDDQAETRNSEGISGSRKKTKRGKRGARKGKRGAKKSMNPDSLEDLKLVPERMLKDGELAVGRLKVDTKTCLGNGSSGTVVFPGQFDGREVAVKRIVRNTHSLAAKEIKHLLSSDENPHVIRYIGKEESTNFTYIALDRFTASLDQVIEHPERCPGLVSLPKGLDVKDALRQITDGVQHLHSLKLVHRDIKPQNVLVRSVKSKRPMIGQPKLQFVISDFGLCRTLEDGPNSTYAPTANHTAAGTSGWRAPELLVSSKAPMAAPPASPSGDSSDTEIKSQSQSSECTVIDPPTGRRATKAIDIFSLGCVFFYIMTQGRHPFDVGGESLGRDLNIKENRSDLAVLRLFDYSFEADDLIMQMLQHHPEDRPNTPTIMLHPYFWDVDTKLDFLCELSDRFEYEKVDPNSPHLLALEAEASNVIGPTSDFLKALPRNFITQMGKQRKYTGSKMLDLLRVIRNKKNHFQDLPENVREMMMGGTSEGYFNFWGRRFPSLLVVCHALVLERGLVDSWRLERYF